MTVTGRHILIFEPGLAGHHLSWLRYVAEDLLQAGYRLTLAVDGSFAARALLQSNLGGVIGDVSLLSAFDDQGKFQGGNILASLASCLEKSGADEAFVNNIDYFASSCLRSAALGILPPAALRGRLSGVYFRPRFLANPCWPPGNIIKAAGFRKLCRQRWFKHILLLDEHLLAEARRNYTGPGFHFLPDPWDGNFPHDQNEAQKALGLPAGRYVLLHYGIGDRRKGLHLTLQALLAEPPDSPLFLVCAGKMSQDKRVASKLTELERRGKVLILDRYVSSAEEKLCFCACDAVLLTYRRHFGSSGVLALAAAAGKMVIASDEGLVGRRVREHKLGLLFSSGKVGELAQCLKQASWLPAEDRNRYREAVLAFSRLCSREAFRTALLAAMDENHVRAVY